MKYQRVTTHHLELDDKDMSTIQAGLILLRSGAKMANGQSFPEYKQKANDLYDMLTPPESD